MLAIGAFGALTTYSTFSFETVALLQLRDWSGGVLNVALNLALGLGAVLIGEGPITVEPVHIVRYRAREDSD